MPSPCPFLSFFFFSNFILLYNTVLVLPYINMNLPRVYTCSQSYPPSNPNSSPVHSMTLVINVCVYAQSFSHVRLFVTFQIPLSMGSSRQEYCSELPCPPPRDLPDPGIKPRSPTLQVVSLPSETPGKPKNTGVDSLSLLHGIFPTQELNQGLLPCRWILYS